MSSPSAALAAAVAAAFTACAAPRSRPAPPPSPEARIRSLARTISTSHVTPVDEARLLAEAARALETEAGPGGPAAGGGDATLAAALDRLRAARPALRPAELIAIAAGAMALSLGDDSLLLPARAIGPPRGAQGEALGSVGLEIAVRQGRALVIRTLPGSPAAAAGVEAGQELQTVDGRPTQGLEVEAVVDLLRGPMGSEAVLGLVSARGAPHQVRVFRRAVMGEAVDCRVLAGDILYLGVRGIGRGTVPEVRRLAGGPDQPQRRVILDLRGSRGGTLDGARDLADLFLGAGEVMSAVGRWPQPDRMYAKLGSSPLETSRLAVLVDGETGSGSEAVAAAVQDHRRGVVLGSHTAGRASIAVLEPLEEGAHLKLVIGVLHRPSGEPIDGRGVVPDVAVDAQGPRAAAPVDDRPCPGFASPSPVAADPVVAAAVVRLMQP